MLLLRKIFATICCSLLGHICHSQVPLFSFATDFSTMRSLKEGQRYWGFGQTVIGQFNFSPKDAAYAWICYYSDGDFTNNVTATAKSPATIPQSIPYFNYASMQVKHMSMGWKHYLVGSVKEEDKINFYGQLGLGLMFGSTTNSQSENIDSAIYNNPVLPGKGKFKRLTYDLGLGIEKPLGGDFFLYLEGKMIIPSTDYPSDYLVVYDDAPLIACMSLGIRILFD